jgi:hypothetical protein
VKLKLVALSALAAAAAFTSLAWSQDPAKEPPKDPSQDAMMEKWAAMMTPAESHRRLDPWAGTFDTTMKIWMMPGGEPRVSLGEAVHTWILGNRFIEMKTKGEMMGTRVEGRGMLGYDNWKKHYVGTWTDSTTTALLTMQGTWDKNPAAKPALHLYGTMDEFLDGTNDKNVRYTWRLMDPDTIQFEVHDLDIGESNSRVIEITYKRRK